MLCGNVLSDGDSVATAQKMPIYYPAEPVPISLQGKLLTNMDSWECMSFKAYHSFIGADRSYPSVGTLILKQAGPSALLVSLSNYQPS